jgi:DNA-binding Lrp family transcriptional regulator
MDERDIEILSAIADLGTGSPDRLHEETGIPKSTIYYRLNNLREQGVIENDLHDVDYGMVGLDVTIIVEVLAEYDEEYHEHVGEKLADIEGVDQVYFTMGETDFIVIARVGNTGMVEDLIGQFESIDEVIRTDSTFVISTIKNEPRLLKNFEFDTLQSIADAEES